MKKIYSLVLLVLIFSLTGCEDVVDIDLDTAPPRLVVEASIDWQKGTTGQQQKIRLTTTAGYYETTVPPVSGAIVTITNSTNTIFNFTETPGTGDYVCTTFVPVIDEAYTLTITVDGQTYKAQETLKAVPEITSVQQETTGGFGSEDVIEIKYYYQDDGAVNNYYLDSFKADFSAFPEYSVTSDEFFQGNQMFGLFSNEDTKQGTQVAIRLFGISERYYNYMQVLLSISGGNGGGPFQTPPASVRGNLVNQTDSMNYALGYFRLSEMEQRMYTVQ